MFKGINDSSFLLKLDCIGYCTSGNPRLIGRELTRIRQERSHSERLGVATVTFPFPVPLPGATLAKIAPKAFLGGPIDRSKTL